MATIKDGDNDNTPKTNTQAITLATSITISLGITTAITRSIANVISMSNIKHQHTKTST